MSNLQYTAGMQLRLFNVWDSGNLSYDMNNEKNL